MSKSFDMKLLLFAMLWARIQLDNVMYDKRKSSRLSLQIAGSEKRFELGSGSM